MSNISVYCYGEIGIDNIIQVDRLPSPEIAVFPSAESDHLGGAAANTSVWLANMGVSVGLSGNVIGKDLLGNKVLNKLSEFNEIYLDNFEIRDDIITPFTRAIVTPDGERSFLIFYYPQTPKTEFKVEMMQNAQYLALDLYGGDERLNAAKTAYESGVQTSIGDVIWFDHKVLPFTSIATNSGAYIQIVFPDINLAEHARKLQSISKGIVVVTNGAEEVFTIDSNGNEFVVKPPVVHVVDATGAGDAFRAGLLYGLVMGFNLETSVCYGVACGTLKVGYWGAATTLPALDDIKDLAKSLKIQ